MATAPRSLARPAKDEWGVYDPQQAGLAALYARLDDSKEVTKTVSPMSSLSRKPAQPTVKAAEQKTEAAPARPTLRDAK
jgi:hypothetical protein